MAKNKIDLTAQPQAIEAEQAVLGSMLISKDAVSKSLQWLPSANYFYKDAHSKIYSCMIDLFDRGDPIDAQGQFRFSYYAYLRHFWNRSRP